MSRALVIIPHKHMSRALFCGLSVREPNSFSEVSALASRTCTIVCTALWTAEQIFEIHSGGINEGRRIPLYSDAIFNFHSPTPQKIKVESLGPNREKTAVSKNNLVIRVPV